MPATEIILNIINSVFDMALCMMFYRMMFEQRKSKTSVWLFSFFFMELLLHINNALSTQLSGIVLTLITVFISITASFIPTFTYKSSARHRIFTVFSFQVISMLGEIIGYNIASSIYTSILKKPMDTGIEFPQFFSKMVMFLLISIISVIYYNKKLTYRYEYSLILLFMPLISIAVMLVVWKNGFDLQGGNNIHSGVIVAILLFSMNLVSYALLDKLMKALILSEKEALLSQQLKSQEEKYEQAVSAHKRNQSIIHDFNKHYIYMSECVKNGKTDELMDYMAKIDNAFKNDNNTVNTGIIAIDAVIGNAVLRCEALNIPFTSNIKVDHNDLKKDDYQLNIILGNLLDNAINSAKESIEQCQPYIDVDIYMTNLQLVINVRNSCDKERTISSESDDMGKSNDFSLHGYGMTNIERSAKEMNGFAYFEQKDGVFSSTVILPL